MRNAFLILLSVVTIFVFQNCGKVRPISQETSAKSNSASGSTINTESLVSTFNNLADQVDFSGLDSDKVAEILQEIQQVLSSEGGGSLFGMNILNAINIFLDEDYDVAELGSVLPSELCGQFQERLSEYQSLVQTVLGLIPNNQGTLLMSLISECGSL